MKQSNGKFYEDEYELALLDLLVEQGWEYTYGGKIHRHNRDVLLLDDLTSYLNRRYPDLTAQDIEEISNKLRHVSK